MESMPLDDTYSELHSPFQATKPKKAASLSETSGVGGTASALGSALGGMRREGRPFRVPELSLL